MSTAVLDRPTVTGEIVTARANRPILAVLATSELQRDGVSLDMRATDLSRYLQQGSLPLIDGHRATEVPVGRVRNIVTHMTGGVRECDCVKQAAGERGASPWSVRALPDHLVGELTFGSSARAKELERLVREGTILDVSTGFDINRRDRWSPVTSWTPQEVSLVGRGMDRHTVIFQRAYRSQEEDTMPHPTYRRSVSEYRTRPYDADQRNNDRRDTPGWTPHERALLRSLLDGGKAYERLAVESYERAVQRRWDAEGREPVMTPWFPATSSATGYRGPASTRAPLHSRADDRSFVHFLPTGIPIED